MKKIAMLLMSVLATLSLLMNCVYAEPTQAPSATEPTEATEQRDATSNQEAPPIQTLKCTIKLDGSSQYEFTSPIDPTQFEMIKTEYAKKGFETEMVSVDNSNAVKLTKATTKEENITFAMPWEEPASFEVLKIKGLFSDMYIVNAKYQMQGYPEMDLMKITFQTPLSAKFSNSVDKSNGGTINNWTLKGGSDNPVTMVLVIPNFISIAILLLVIIILIVLYFTIKKNKKKKLDDESAVLLDDDMVAVDSDESIEDAKDPYEDMTIEEITADIKEVEDDNSDKDK